ncbi:MAG: methyltransferase [Bacteroidales bacterium]|nr:methyltransferase [Bacteroidales bacterium]
MTSRERILAVVRHQQTDRVPIDLGATPSSGISAQAYHNLIQHLGIKGSKTLIYDTVQELAQPEQVIIDRFGVDVLDVGRAFFSSESDWYPFDLTPDIQAYYPNWFKPDHKSDGSWEVYKNKLMIARKPFGATFFDSTHFPYIDGYPTDYKALEHNMKNVLWAAMPVSPWADADKPGFWEELRTKALMLRETTDKALIIGVGCNLFEWGTFLRRLDNFLMDVYADPDNVERLLDALLEIHLVTLDKVCTAVGDIVDFVKFGDDLGMDNGPFMAPEIYRKIFKPRHKQLCDFAKSHSKMIPYLHSCGSIYQLLPDLIDAGFEVINPVQTNCYQMEPERLKKEFGQDVCFWGGGVDTRTVLNNGTPEQVRDQVQERLEIFSQGGGFVFNTVHNILPDVPPENIVAMFDTVLKF